MKKFISFIFITAFVSIVLIGCQSEDNTTIDTNQTQMDEQTEALSKNETDKIDASHQLDGNKEKLILDGKIVKVSLSKLEENETIDFEDDETLELFTNLISKAVKNNGIVAMVSPKFTFNVVYDNESKQSFNLWIGNKGGRSTIMDMDDTHTIYMVSEEMTGILIDLIES